MKKLLSLVVASVLALSLVACGGGSAAPASEAEPTPEPIPDLSGDWEQSNKNSETSFHTATIEGDVIEIYWTDTETDTKSLYWAGTFEAPTSADPYSWDSVNDTEKTASALLASGDDTKTFTYEDGIISYEASALGTTQTVKLEKVQ